MMSYGVVKIIYPVLGVELKSYLRKNPNKRMMPYGVVKKSDPGFLVELKIPISTHHSKNRLMPYSVLRMIISCSSHRGRRSAVNQRPGGSVRVPPRPNLPSQARPMAVVHYIYHTDRPIGPHWTRAGS